MKEIYERVQFLMFRETEMDKFMELALNSAAMVDVVGQTIQDRHFDARHSDGVYLELLNDLGKSNIIDYCGSVVSSIFAMLKEFDISYEEFYKSLSKSHNVVKGV